MQSSQSHQVLARKWRPRDFESLVGQDTVVRALRHALDNNRLHHAYLLTGTRGVGKTTIARILAKALNCETGITSRPCGRCDACMGVDQGRFPDYVEMDAASNRKVEEMTLVLENAAYSPSIGRYKVFVIDEVHMLTNHAFNAMLKTLEEPPAHVVFVLATTDPQKVPVTVLSRCMQFGLRNMSAGRRWRRIWPTCSRKRRLPSKRRPWNCSRALRPAACGTRCRCWTRRLRWAADPWRKPRSGRCWARWTAGWCRNCCTCWRTEPPREVDRARRRDGRDQPAVCADPDGAGAGAAARRAGATGSGTGVEETADGADADSVAKLAGVLAPEDVQVWYQVAIHAARDLPLAPDPHTGFVMALIRMMAFKAGGAERLARGYHCGAGRLRARCRTGARGRDRHGPRGVTSGRGPPASAARFGTALASAAARAPAPSATPAPLQATVRRSSGKFGFDGDWSA